MDLFDISIALAGLAAAFDEGQRQGRSPGLINHFLRNCFSFKEHSLADSSSSVQCQDMETSGRRIAITEYGLGRDVWLSNIPFHTYRMVLHDG